MLEWCLSEEEAQDSNCDVIEIKQNRGIQLVNKTRFIDVIRNVLYHNEIFIDDLTCGDKAPQQIFLIEFIFRLAFFFVKTVINILFRIQI